MAYENMAVLFAGMIPLIIILGIWETVWKAIAMWKAARNNHLAWYIVILIFNTVGILPIIYLLVYKDKKPLPKKIKKANKKIRKSKKGK